MTADELEHAQMLERSARHHIQKLREAGARIAALEQERDTLKDEIDYAMRQCDGKSIGKIIEELDEAHAAIRGAMRIFRESAPNSFAGAWLPDYEKAHAPAIRRASEGKA